MTAKHTPGPWRLEARGLVVAANSELVADTFDKDANPADSRLIAAAPDMLAALKYITLYRSCTGGPQKLVEEFQHVARAAIAKAEGAA